MFWNEFNISGTKRGWATLHGEQAVQKALVWERVSSLSVISQSFCKRKYPRGR
jgi:hypothetical protein